MCCLVLLQNAASLLTHARRRLLRILPARPTVPMLYRLLGVNSPSQHRRLPRPRRLLRQLMHRMLGFNSPSMQWLLSFSRMLRRPRLRTLGGGGAQCRRGLRRLQTWRRQLVLLLPRRLMHWMLGFNTPRMQWLLGFSRMLRRPRPVPWMLRKRGGDGAQSRRGLRRQCLQTWRRQLLVLLPCWLQTWRWLLSPLPLRLKPLHRQLLLPLPHRLQTQKTRWRKRTQ